MHLVLSRLDLLIFYHAILCLIKHVIITVNTLYFISSISSHVMMMHKEQYI